LSEGKRVMDEMSREGEMSHGGPGDRASAATEQSGEQTHNARRDRSGEQRRVVPPKNELFLRPSRRLP